MNYNFLTIYYEDHGSIAYDLTVTKRYGGNESFQQLKSFVELLKSQCPASNRVYNPQTKIWTIEKQIFDTHILKLMDMLSIKYVKGSPQTQNSRFDSSSAAPKIDPNNFFYDTVPIAKAQTRESVTESLARILGCTPTDLGQPLDIVKKLYRRKALELHPDRNNGDGSKMSELNSLWSVYNS